MFDDSQRVTRPSPASAIAITAISTASPITSSASPPCTIASTTRPASTGVATASTAIATLSSRKIVSLARCGRAKARMRCRVARENGRRSPSSCMAWYIDMYAVTSMSTRSSLRSLPAG